MENEQTPESEQEQIEETVETTEEESPTEDEVDYKALYEAEMERKKLRRQKFIKKPEENRPITTNSDQKWRERMELKVEGYDDQAIDFIQKNGGKKALENPYVVKAIEALKEQKLAEKATIDSGTKSEVEKRFSPQEFAKLPHSEQLKVLSELN